MATLQARLDAFRGASEITGHLLVCKARIFLGEGFFVGSIAGEEITFPKPAPDMYLEAARRVQAHPSECLVFEDSWNGMNSAVAAGCHVIGVVEPGQWYLEGVTPSMICR